MTPHLISFRFLTSVMMVCIPSAVPVHACSDQSPHNLLTLTEQCISTKQAASSLHQLWVVVLLQRLVVFTNRFQIQGRYCHKPGAGPTTIPFSCTQTHEYLAHNNPLPLSPPTPLIPPRQTVPQHHRMHKTALRRWRHVAECGN